MRLASLRGTNSHTRKARPPLRTAKELAEEFGVSLRAFNAAAKASGAPKPVRVTTANFSRSGEAWFDPAVMRAWWAVHQAYKREAAAVMKVLKQEAAA